MDIIRVQQWIGATLVFVVGMAPAAMLGFLGGSYVGDGRTGDGIALWVMAGVVGLITMAGCLLIHRHRLPSAWLLVGLLPSALSAPTVF